MWAYCQQVKQALSDWSRRYISDEDPDERRSRLRQQALEEINAQVLPVIQLRMAMRVALEGGRGQPLGLSEAA